MTRPPVDYAKFRADLDAMVDQEPRHDAEPG
jgi:hypothetical protein